MKLNYRFRSCAAIGLFLYVALQYRLGHLTDALVQCIGCYHPHDFRRGETIITNIA